MANPELKYVSQLNVSGESGSVFNMSSAAIQCGPSGRPLRFLQPSPAGRWFRWAAVAVAMASLTAGSWAKDKVVTLPELIQEMREREQEDGFFRAKVTKTGELRAVFLSGTFTLPENVRALTGVSTLESFNTGCLPATAFQEVAKILPAMVHLEKLNLISPVAKGWNLDLFKTIGRLESLRQIRLSYATIPNGALKFLGDLPNLEALELSSVNLANPEDLQHLQRCPKLVELNLRSTRVGDSVLPLLLALPALKWLDVEHSQLSEAAKVELTAKGVTLRALLDHKDMADSPWRPWME